MGVGMVADEKASLPDFVEQKTSRRAMDEGGGNGAFYN
jgi:hypothetical protein